MRGLNAGSSVVRSARERRVERTSKVPYSSIHHVFSEPIKGSEDYHILVRRPRPALP